MIPMSPKNGRGRPKGSGLGKYKGKPAKYPPDVRKFWRDQYEKRKKKKEKK